MGREVRKVPPDWQHPKVYRYGEEKYQPMYDTSFKEAEADWLADFDRIRAGEMTELEKECYPEGLMAWANDESPPNPKYYMPDWPDEERTHFQMYEDTSEGTPISPVMEGPEALARWLAETGASSFGHSTATYEQWLPICKGGFAPSMVIAGGRALSGVEAMSETDK